MSEYCELTIQLAAIVCSNMVNFRNETVLVIRTDKVSCTTAVRARIHISRFKLISATDVIWKYVFCLYTVLTCVLFYCFDNRYSRNTELVSRIHIDKE